MSATYSITKGRACFRRMIKHVQAGQIATIVKGNAPVAYLVGKERMSALVETLEIFGNPIAMKAIRDHEEGKLKKCRISDIPD
jgi:prevent-host-death family protein